MFLGTVRRKLTALVAFSALAAFVILPILWWLMHRALIDEVDDRVPEAISGLTEELSDDLKDLDVTSRVLSEFPATEHALAAGDAAQLVKLVGPFRDAYPDLDMLFYSSAGARVGQIGWEPARSALAPGLGTEHTLLEHGCEADEHAPIAVAVVGPIGAAGFVLVCMPLDANYFKNAQTKLGLELALDLGGGGSHSKVVFTTRRFPSAYFDALDQRDGAMVDTKRHTWALGTLDAALLNTPGGGHPRFVAALDVTNIKDIINRELLTAFAIVLATTVIALAIGWRLASRMSRALSRVNAAMRKLERQEYVKVETGADRRRARGSRGRLQLDGRRAPRARQAARHDGQVHDRGAGPARDGRRGRARRQDARHHDHVLRSARLHATLSEKRSAHEIVGLLNEYFTEMVDCVMAEGGVVDKYIGDNIMAVFGAPVTRPDDALRAVRAAVRMREALVKLNERFTARGLSTLRFGIGLHSGEVVAGNIGSARRMEYTVIGDAVNVASRLESKTKELGTDILISDATNERVTSGVATEAIGEIHVKGRAEAVQIYKVGSIKAVTPSARSSAASWSACAAWL